MPYPYKIYHALDVGLRQQIVDHLNYIWDNVSLEGLKDVDITTNPLLEGQGIWYDADSGLWKNRISYTEAWPTGLADGGELNIGPGVNDIEVITGAGAVIDAYTNPFAPPVAKILTWDQINEPITAAPSTAGSVVWFAIEDTGVPGVPTEYGGVPNFVGQLVQYTAPPSPTLARQQIFLGVAVHNGVTWNEISNPKVINQAAETLREYVVNVTGPSWIISGGTVSEQALFTLNQAEGVIWENNRNWHVDKSDPNREALPAATPINFQYVNRDFTDVSTPPDPTIDPLMWDNAGTVEAVPPPANNTTIQRLYIDPANNYWMLWGQKLYPTWNAAAASLQADNSTTVVPFILQKSILLGYVITERNQTDWTALEAVFFPAGGSSGGASGGGLPITTFLELVDTPISYVGLAGYLTTVNDTEDGLVFDNKIETFLKTDPNVLTFGVGEDPGPWIIADGTVPLVDVGAAIGPWPPTIAANVITINAAGYYDITCAFGIDIGSGGNTATIDIYINGLDAQAITAGVEFSGGQAAPIVQPTARAYRYLDVGDTVSFVATELGTDNKLLLYGISGGSVTLTAYDFDKFPPP